MEVLQIRKKFQITLPRSIRERLHLEEGDYVAVEVRDDEIVLRPKKLIDKSQTWFWSEAWQAAEREAEADIQAGRVHEFPDAEEAIAFLHRRAAGEPEEE
jgi:AbrB family looped-hinge helix DNA binding protein